MRITIIIALVALVAQNARSQAPAEPHPQPAVPSVLAAFERFPIVALGMSHRLQDEADLTLAIIRDPAFARIANAVVVECGNPLYQSDMDRYVAGADVPMDRLQLFWRNTTQPVFCNGGPHRALVDAVREVNRRLPENRRVRLLAGDSPIDWDRARGSDDVAPFMSQRDTYFASVVAREVLAKHQKALLVIGGAHVFHASALPAGPKTATMLIEESHPHSVFVIQALDGFGERNAELEPRLSSWPIASLANIDSTWLGRLEAGPILQAGGTRVIGPNGPIDLFPGMKLQDLADAYLYLGPKASLRIVEAPHLTDSAYTQELRRRQQLIGGPVPVPARSRQRSR